MSDLRAAAERLLKFPHGYEPDSQRIAILDFDKLAKAYLAEHPADNDESITEEWLRSVGAIEDALGCYIGLGENGEAILFLLDDESPGNIAGCTILHSDYGEHIKTRGDVRRLCAALGITLKEPANG